MADQGLLDPQIVANDHHRRRGQPTTPSTADNDEDASDDDGQDAGEPEPGGHTEGDGKRRKLNRYKCRQCREARRKCLPEGRVWPEKCHRCLHHRPHPLECSEPEINNNVRGPNKEKKDKAARESKAQSTVGTRKQTTKEPTEAENPGSNVEEVPLFERPLRTPAMKGVKRERSGSPKFKLPLVPPSGEEASYPQSAYLPLAESEFRILVLLPGQKDADVCFSFETASQSNPPEYETVSYQWGGIDEALQEKVDIKLQDRRGKSHTVSTKKNVCDALRSLRHPTAPRKFWIDALCIKRPSETNQQVEMKRFIFRNAQNLCFWLGEDEIAKTALPFVKKMLKPITAIDKLVKNPNEIQGWLALVALLKNTVFSRLWFVQEVALAYPNVTLHCGQPAIHYEDLVDAVAMCATFGREISQLFRDCGEDHKELLDRRVRMAERFIDVSTNALRTTPSGEVQRLLSLEALVSLLSGLGAGNPLDRIFSVLMIAKDGPSMHETFDINGPSDSPEDNLLRIDYAKSVPQLYQDFVAHAIKRSKSLNIICRYWASSVSEKDARLPTWVRPLQSSLQAPPKKDVPGRTTADSLVGLPDRSFYHASRGRPAEVRYFVQPFPDSETRILCARGCRIDTISKLGPRASEGNILFEWLELAGCNWIDGHISFIPDVFWRTLVGDRSPHGSNAPSWYNRALSYVLEQIAAPLDLNTSRFMAKSESSSNLVVEFLQRVQSVIWNRRLLVSESKGMIGLAPPPAQTGDEICILYGCSVPVVLRPLTKDGKQYWHLVGECYVHGIMDGEAMEDDFSCDKEAEFELL